MGLAIFLVSRILMKGHMWCQISVGFCTEVDKRALCMWKKAILNESFLQLMRYPLPGLKFNLTLDAFTQFPQTIILFAPPNIWQIEIQILYWTWWNGSWFDNVLWLGKIGFNLWNNLQNSFLLNLRGRAWFHIGEGSVRSKVGRYLVLTSKNISSDVLASNKSEFISDNKP